MRILDVELQQIIDQLNYNELEKLKKAISDIESDRIYRQGISDVELIQNPFINTDELRNLVEAYFGPDKANIIDDDKAIEDITDKNEKESVLLQRQPLMPGKNKKSVRVIPEESAYQLIRRARIMNPGREYAAEFSKMSSEQIKNYRLYNESVKLDRDTKFNIDPKYGINTADKHDVLKIMEAKAYVRELVSQIPTKEFKLVKSNFEKLRNNPTAHYSRTGAEIEAMTEKILGKECDRIYAEELNMADFASAFDDRAKELQAKSKKGIWSKIKNFFARDKKVKALPEGKTEENKDLKNDFLAGINVSSDVAKYQVQGLQKKHEKLIESKDDGPNL